MLLHHVLTTSARRVVNEPGWRADGQGGMPQGPRRARGSQPGMWWPAFGGDSPARGGDSMLENVGL